MTRPEFSLPEFSRIIPVDRVTSAGLSETITAKPDERAALAKRFGLVSLESLSANITLRAELGLIHVGGRLEADIVQTCVVTLEPFPSHLEDSFNTDFGMAAEQTDEDGLFDPDYEPPEPIEDGIIDIGELTAQFLALALDPHPRAPGVSLETVWSDEGNAPKSPFAVLEGLKRQP